MSKMKTLHIRIASIEQIKREVAKAWADSEAGLAVKCKNSVAFQTYDDMHRVLSPARLAIACAMAGQEPMSIREVARLVERDVKAVHSDLTMLVNAGVVNRTEAGVSFPYDQIHFEFHVSAAT